MNASRVGTQLGFGVKQSQFQRLDSLDSLAIHGSDNMN
jgi:hypothetical protein